MDVMRHMIADSDAIVEDRLDRTLCESLNPILELARRGVGVRNFADPIRVDLTNPDDDPMGSSPWCCWRCLADGAHLHPRAGRARPRHRDRHGPAHRPAARHRPCKDRIGGGRPARTRARLASPSYSTEQRRGGLPLVPKYATITL